MRAPPSLARDGSERRLQPLLLPHCRDGISLGGLLAGSQLVVHRLVEETHFPCAPVTIENQGISGVKD